MSREQWGHGYWTGYAEGQKAGTLTPTGLEPRPTVFAMGGGVHVVFHRTYPCGPHRCVADVSGYYQGREVARMLRMDCKNPSDVAAFEAMAEHNRLHGIDLQQGYQMTLELTDAHARREYAMTVSAMTGISLDAIVAGLESLIHRIQEHLLLQEAGK